MGPCQLAAGLKSGKLTLSTGFYDVLKVFNPGGGAPPWTAHNYNAEHLDGILALDVALAHSVNTVYAQLMEAVGPNAVVAMAKDLGITSPLENNYALVLGTSDVTLLELTSAYRTLANQGRCGAPRFILEENGQKWPNTEQHRCVSPALAYVTTSAMKKVFTEGTAKSMKDTLPGWEKAGKTGTTTGSTDAYFVGYTRDLVVGVWVGYDKRRPMAKGATGGKYALPIWTKTMEL